MRALFIGGTGNISHAASQRAIARGWDLYLLNRGRRDLNIQSAHSLIADIKKPQEVAQAIKGLKFDVVVNWIAFTPEDVERDIELFANITQQYIFISSASAYQKPPQRPFITESTPLANPYWRYSQDKISCELRLMQEYRNNGFPVTIARPSLTYDTVIPVALGSWADYTIVDRMKRNQPIVVHGDGTSLWTITHAQDFAKGLVGLMAHKQAIAEAFHITSDEILTWNQIYETLADAAGVKAQLVHATTEDIAHVADAIGQPHVKGGLWGDKSPSAIFDNTKIKTFVPDFCANIAFSEGIRKTLAWFEADPKRQKIIPQNNQLLDKIIDHVRR